MNAFIPLVTRASYTRKRDLIAPTVSKMTPKMASKMTPETTSGTPSKASETTPSPERLGKGSGSPNAYKTNENDPPEPQFARAAPAARRPLRRTCRAAPATQRSGSGLRVYYSTSLIGFAASTRAKNAKNVKTQTRNMDKNSIIDKCIIYLITRT